MHKLFLLVRSSALRNHKAATGWGWELTLSRLNDYLESEGSLNLKVKADFYVDSDGTAEILEDKQERPKSEVESLKMRKGIILNKIASLLGNEITSDVIISIRTTEDVEIGTFFCHSAILAGKSNMQNNNI